VRHYPAPTFFPLINPERFEKMTANLTTIKVFVNNLNVEQLQSLAEYINDRIDLLLETPPDNPVCDLDPDDDDDDDWDDEDAEELDGDGWDEDDDDDL
jgi:hypothetical protein